MAGGLESKSKDEYEWNSEIGYDQDIVPSTDHNTEINYELNFKKNLEQESEKDIIINYKNNTEKENITNLQKVEELNTPEDYGQDSKLMSIQKMELISEQTLNPSELPLPPLPEASPKDEFPFEFKFKYAEDPSFLTLHQLPPLQKIILCVSANVSARRIWICHQLHVLLHELSIEEGLVYVFPLMLRLCQDEVQAVREALVENLHHLLLFYYQPKEIPENKNPFKIDSESFVQLLSLTLFASSPSLSTLASESIQKFCHTVNSETLETYLLPLFIRLLAEPNEYSYENDFDPTQYIQQSPSEIKSIIFTLLQEIIPLLKEQTLVEVILPIIENSSTDESFDIRKALLHLLKLLFNLLPASVLSKRLYPTFTLFAQDYVYEVRQLACEMLLDLTELLIPIGKGQCCLIRMQKFLNDPSLKVKSTACELLGRFIYLFHDSEIPDSLLKKFLSNCKASKPEIRRGCAYHLPAVVLALGSSGWHQIKPMFFLLSRDKHMPVQRSLAASIHELAKILSPEQTKSDLLPVFLSFLSASKHQEVQLAALENVSSFLIYISVTERSKLLPNLLEAFQRCLIDPGTQIHSWRSREPYILQLGILLEQSRLEEGIRLVLPLLLFIAQSQVPPIVRSWAIQSIPSFYYVIDFNRSANSELLMELFEQFNFLLHSPNFRDRLLYVLICRKMSEDTRSLDLDDFFLPNLSKLVVDKVIDVRLAVAQLLRDVCIQVSSSPPSGSSNAPTPTEEPISPCLPPANDIRKFITQELISRFQPEDHQDIRSIVDSLSIHVNALTLTS